VSYYNADDFGNELDFNTEYQFITDNETLAGGGG